MTNEECKAFWMKTVVEIWPQAVTEDIVQDLLWNTTCFPFGSDERVIEQLKEYHDKSGGDIHKAEMIVIDEMNAAHAEYMKTLNETDV